MSRLLVLIVVVLFPVPAVADETDWTGKTVRIKESVKLGSKLGGGLVRDGMLVEKGKTFVVKSDDGSFLELVGQPGYLFKSEAEVVAGREMPKKGDPEGKEDKNLWPVGTKVLPKKRPGQIQFGDRDKDGKQVDFKMSGILPMEVRKDNGDGWVRIHDGHREGWVSKDDLVTKEDAPIYWDQAVKANPKDTWALNMRGVSWWQKGEQDNAIKDFSECIRLDPKYASAYNGRGLAWSAKKEYDKAIEDYNEAIRLDPKHARAYYNRGTALYYKKDYDKAIEDYNEAFRLDPKYTLAIYSRGNAWNAKKEYDKAIEDYTEAIRLDSKYTLAIYSRGLAWSAKKEYDKAIEDYTEAIRLDPKHTRAFNNRGLAWYYKKEYDKAIADYDRVLELESKYAVYFNNRGLAWLAKKEYDKAIEDYTEAIRLDPKYVAAFTNRGRAWHYKKEYDKAIEDYTEAIRLDPKYAVNFNNRGLTWYFKKEYDKAIADYDRALELDSKYVFAIGNKSRSLAKLKKYDDAVKGFDAAMGLNPMDWLHREYALFLSSCPDARYRDGKKAVELAKKAIEKAGKDADWQYYAALAAAYAEAGDFELAIVEQRKALDAKSLDAADTKEMETRLELYRAKKPFRDEVK